MRFRPTKACDVENPKDLRYPLYMMIKYDGVWSTVRDGALFGRSLKPTKNKQICEELGKESHNYLIGELCYGKELNTQDLCRNTTSHINSHDKEWKDGYTWVIFDYAHPDFIDLGYTERMLEARKVIDGLGNPNIIPVTLMLAEYWEDLEDTYNNFLDFGYEGLIVREIHGKYKHGRSTVKEQIFMRMKPSDFEEAIIISVNEAMENNNEAVINELGYTERSSHQENKIGLKMVGSFNCIRLTDGLEIVVGAGKLTHEERKHLYENAPICLITKYKSMTTGVKDLPRFPRHYEFRDIRDLDDALYANALEAAKLNGLYEDHKHLF